MSVHELCLQLSAVAQRLPAAELADAQAEVELAHGHLASAWDASAHPCAHAALAATADAAQRLGEIVAALEQVAAAIDQYTIRP